jgi:hypothetical protein
MYKCWLEDTSLDSTLNLVFNDGKGSSLILPDRIGFVIFRLVCPLDIRLSGHFRCDAERLRNIMESAEGNLF